MMGFELLLYENRLCLLELLQGVLGEPFLEGFLNLDHLVLDFLVEWFVFCVRRVFSVSNFPGKLMKF